ncbi:hypothetical protein E2553_43935 [Paraburkholderia dipogonis]|uniref:Transposase n=2 Tax=Paraburkholderia TaxID=1822464 RepID=A0A4Y8MGQ3_9BURK|nr:hypothetical protein [Paraburkholderia dipogonis]TFE36640.1 hypothetical protein E2553_43935 [Paraburkholderia dipogonis]
MLATLQALGVMPSLSRPGVSNDNPLFRVAVQAPEVPARLPAQGVRYLFVARTWVGALVRGYNDEHRHSAILFVTPAQRHANLDQDILDRRMALYETARQRNPLRWTGRTRKWQRISTVHLNPDRTHNLPGTPQRDKQERKTV